MKITTTLMCLFMLSAFGHELEFGNYLKLQGALASDDFKNAQASHREICAEELGHYKKNYSGCDKKHGNIGELRESFKSLSKLYIGNGKTKELEKLQVMECSMAKAKWAQEKGDVKNPYYGKKMLACGEKSS